MKVRDCYICFNTMSFIHYFKKFLTFCTATLYKLQLSQVSQTSVRTFFCKIDTKFLRHVSTYVDIANISH